MNILLFLTLCMGSRYSLAYLSKTYLNLLPTLSILALFPAIGFLVIYLFKLRKTGIETGGEIIYWDNFRPLHAVMFFLFSYLAYNRNSDAWKVLFLDTTIGLIVFLKHHFL